MKLKPIIVTLAILCGLFLNALSARAQDIVSTYGDPESEWVLVTYEDLMGGPDTVALTNLSPTATSGWNGFGDAPSISLGCRVGGQAVLVVSFQESLAHDLNTDRGSIRYRVDDGTIQYLGVTIVDWLDGVVSVILQDTMLRRMMAGEIITLAADMYEGGQVAARFDLRGLHEGYADLSEMCDVPIVIRATQTTSPTITPFPTTSATSTFCVITAELNIRTRAGYGHQMAAEAARNGECGTILSGPISMDNTRWYEVRMDDGRTGWIPARINRVNTIAFG